VRVIAVVAAAVCVVVAVEAGAQGGGDCHVGLVVEEGESCTYPGTDVEFRVDGSGSGRFLFFTSGQRLSLRATSINGVLYTFVAARQSGGGWLIEEIAGSAPTTTNTTTNTNTTIGTTTNPTAPLVDGPAGFSDVDAGSVHRAAVESLGARGVFEETECGLGRFCPGDPVKRWEMAVWLVRILDGADPDPLYYVVSRFADIDIVDWWAPHVERLAELGVTTGCSKEPARFCPYETVTRAQMASFLVRAFKLPPAHQAGFTDVVDGVHAANINSLAASGITTGCQTHPPAYCPGQNTTRDQMATFLTRARPPVGGEPPASLGFDQFYKKYLDADGIPIISSSFVPDNALYTARSIVTQMLTYRPDLAKAMAEMGQRAIIAGDSERLSDLPHVAVDPTLDDYDGVYISGGRFSEGLHLPLTIARSSALLCSAAVGRPNNRGDVMVHEFAHAIHHSLSELDSGFDMRLDTAYKRAIAAGLWENTYAGTNRWEYWAVGTEHWFGLSGLPGPFVSDIAGPDELAAYDQPLAALLAEVFGDASVSASCHEAFFDYPPFATVEGTVTNPDGKPPTQGVTLFLWEATRENSGEWAYTGMRWQTGLDSTLAQGLRFPRYDSFFTRVPVGTYWITVAYGTDDTYGCRGYYDGNGITTNRSDAKLVTVEADGVVITIRLTVPVEDLSHVSDCEGWKWVDTPVYARRQL